MNRTSLKQRLFFIVAFALVGIASTQAAEKAPRVVTINDSTPKLSVSYSQIGVRNTLLFYTLSESKAVLRLDFVNMEGTPVFKATCILFDPNTTEEGIKKWLNNQHSDGLFPDVPVPVKTLKIPAENCKVTEHKFLEKKKPRFGDSVYEHHAIEFEVREFATDDIKLEAFASKEKVFVKSK